MKTLVCGALAVILLAVAAYCLFGFLASFEPVANAITFRVFWALLGLGSLGGAAVLVSIGLRKKI
ncbi:MAG: hypothetical protein VX738_11505 [Planctomycetota bacterium]|nr:hypothetical protein [Planctomycetota bacterium]